jgi:hypothetical protein
LQISLHFLPLAQTVGGHRYRTRSVGNVIEEIAWSRHAFPQVKEFFFDHDTFTDDRSRREAIARELGRLGVTWSCNAKANVPRETLKIMRDNGLRLLLVGYESAGLMPITPNWSMNGARRVRRFGIHTSVIRKFLTRSKISIASFISVHPK